MKTCPIQELCLYYDSGDNKPKNNDVRHKYPCKKFIDMTCEESIRIQLFLGEEIACDIEKIKRIKSKLPKKKSKN